MVQDVLSLLRPNDARRTKTTFPGLASLLTTSAAPAQRTIPIGSELRQLISALVQSGRELHEVADAALAPHIRDVLDRIDAISCRIAVVGQVKAGKSSFINALMQRGELLPTHVNPWTAVATKLHFGTPGRPVTGCDFTFFTADEWAGLGAGEGETAVDDGAAEMKSRAEVRLGDQFHHLLGKSHFYQSVQAETLQNYLCAGPPVDEVSRDIKPGRYADITKSANVYFPLPPLAVPAILIDTPGTNDSTHLRHRITREIIEGADIYIMVLTARQPLTGADLGLLQLLRGLEKKRIIVFINRVDELNAKASATDLLVAHVKNELARVFGDAAIPVLAGSAKWAGLATLDTDIEALRAEAENPAFQAIAAQKSITLPPRGGEDELVRLQYCFRAASGLDSITRLLSLFMLSGFVSNHARGVAEVILSAADAAAISARRDLGAILGSLRQAVPDADAAFAEIDALLNTIGRGVEAIGEGAAPAISEGIARLGTALEALIQSVAEPRKPAIGAADKNGLPGSDGPAPRALAPAAPERPDWLTSVKEATFDFLRKALVETTPPAEQPAPAPPPPPKPAGTRPTSLTVPVTARARDLSMDSGASWWSEWMRHQKLDAERGEALTRIVRQEFAARSTGTGEAGRERLRALSEDSARRMGLTSIALLTRLADRFRALQSGAFEGSDEARQQLAVLIAEQDEAISEACLAIAAHENVNRQIRALFTPPRPAG